MIDSSAKATAFFAVPAKAKAISEDIINLMQRRNAEVPCLE
jgi:hypothetical protein